MYKQPEIKNRLIAENDDEESTIMSRVFKKRYIEADEVEIYLSLPAAEEQVDPLQWWKVNESQYPRLAQMVYDYLAIPAISVPSERCFSASGNLITLNRNRLSGKTTRASMCLQSWWTNHLDFD
jgi:hypothetical protein